MEQRIIEEAAKNRGISPDAVIREYYEYLLLKELYESPVGDKIVFKGGTAMRIFYGLPRYSDDLDFTMEQKFTFETFSKAVNAAVKKFDNMKISGLWDKNYTYICEIKVTESWMKMPFSIKVEISKREAGEKRQAELKMAVSEDFKTQVFGKVYSLDSLYLDKKDALSGRDEPKDYFDLWYICQLKKIPFEPGKKPDKKRYRQVLGRYLPRKYLKALDEIL